MGSSIKRTGSSLRSGSVGGAFSCSSPLGYSGGVARGGRLMVTVANRYPSTAEHQGQAAADRAVEGSAGAEAVEQPDAGA